MSVKGTGLLPLTASNLQQTLFILRSANMTLTTDQSFVKVFPGTKYVVYNVVGVRVSGAFGTACLGGVYDAASKGGNALVAATQTWASMTGANTCTEAILAAIANTTVETATPFLSLTTGNTGALAADIFISGVCVD